MAIVKVKFSRIPEYDQEYMEKQKVYSYACEQVPTEKVLYGTKYKKYMHVVEIQEENDSTHFSPEKLAYATKKIDDTFIELGVLVTRSERHESYLIANVV